MSPAPAGRRVGPAAAATALLLLLLIGLVLPRTRLIEPVPTVLLVDRHGEKLADLPGPDGALGYWPLDSAPDRVAAATLCLEDRRFADHPGVDPLALLRAARQNLQAGGRISGASTLAMQLARMQAPGPRTYPRKLLEALVAIGLTARHGRDGVLRQYLRLAPYGNNVHGVAYAARWYFDKPVGDLSWAEVAFLTALPQAPSHTNPFDPSGRARAVVRARRILQALEHEGRLSPIEGAAAAVDLDQLVITDRRSRPGAALHPILRAEAELPERGRPPILHSSLDLALQEELQALVSHTIAPWRSRGAGNAALLVVDRETAEVLAAVGSADWADPAHAGAIDYTRVPRNPGSTLKPLFYAAALDAGVLFPWTILADTRRARGGIGNADGAFLGPLLPRQALANSRNVPAVEVLERLGLERGYELLRRLGLHKGEVPARTYGLGLAVGALPVTLEQLVTAYQGLAGDGRARPLVWEAGRISTPGERLWSEASARRVGLWLSDPLARLPTFPRMGTTEYPFPVAVKTGTSGDYRDAWAVGWSSRLLVGVWVGDPDWQPMAHLSGFTAAADILQRVMNRLHAHEARGGSDIAPPSPEGALPVRLCALSGQRTGPACDRVTTEPLEPETGPTEPCRVHQRHLVDPHTGELATSATRHPVLRTFVALGPEYAAWQAQAGLPRPPGSTRGPEAAEARPRLRVLSPDDGARLSPDPEAPAGQSTLSLEASVDTDAPQLLWLVDGEALAVVEPPYTLRWPLTVGVHTFEVAVPRTPWRSAPVTVVVERP